MKKKSAKAKIIFVAAKSASGRFWCGSHTTAVIFHFHCMYTCTVCVHIQYMYVPVSPYTKNYECMSVYKEEILTWNSCPAVQQYYGNTVSGPLGG